MPTSVAHYVTSITDSIDASIGAATGSTLTTKEQTHVASLLGPYVNLAAGYMQQVRTFSSMSGEAVPTGPSGNGDTAGYVNRLRTLSTMLDAVVPVAAKLDAAALAKVTSVLHLWDSLTTSLQAQLPHAIRTFSSMSGEGRVQ